MIDLVIGAAHGYSAKQVRPFLKSLRMTGYVGKIILYADGGGANEASRWDVEIQACPTFRGKPHAARFLWIQKSIEDNPCEGVLLADTRDVIFQSNPSLLPAIGLHTFEEDRSMTLGSCPYNSKWLRIGYGEKILEELSHLPISCVGATCGDWENVSHYLTLLREEINRIQPKTNEPQDQAAHNFLIYKKIPSTIWNNEVGDIYTVGYIPKHTVVLENGKILNRAGDIPIIVHQWDRHKNLSNLVEATLL